MMRNEEIIKEAIRKIPDLDKSILENNQIRIPVWTKEVGLGSIDVAIVVFDKHIENDKVVWRINHIEQ